MHPLLLQVHLFHVRLEVALVGRREGARVARENPAACSPPIRRLGNVCPVAILELNLQQQTVL